jgi:uncharacterized Tic20 family protein
MWGTLAHAAVALALILPGIGGWAGPLAIKLTKARDSRFVDDNATEALNYGIALSVVQLAVSYVNGLVVQGGAFGGALPLIGNAYSLLPILVAAAALVLPGIAALNANGGKQGGYPDFLPRLVPRSGDAEHGTKH